jgi:hypothetical protein
MADDGNRLVNRTERNEATSFRDHAGGPPSEAKANNGRPNDLEIKEHTWALANSTLAERAKKAKARNAKQVSEGENKQVASAESKGRRSK